MNATELLDLLRAEVRDNAVPYLISDEVLYAYINDAQNWFCRLTEGIEDARSFVVDVVPGVEWYPINRRILKPRRAYDIVTGRPVPLVSLERAGAAGISFAGTSGPLCVFVTGAEKNALRAWPVPTQSVKVQLEVFRLPKTVGEGDLLEIDDQHHLPLLLWAKHLVYGTEDADLFDRRKAEEYESKFHTYCAYAKAEQGRARHQAGAVQYGGY